MRCYKLLTQKTPKWVIKYFKNKFLGHEYTFNFYWYRNVPKGKKVYSANVFKNGYFYDNSIHITN